jgi:pyrroline-5-carboxylate reductase
VPETLLDAVTGLVGSGPAYLFLVAEALIDAGVLAGSTPYCRRFGAATVRRVGGDARRVRRPESLRAMVTSPGGTTAAGLRAGGARTDPRCSAVFAQRLEVKSSATH